MSSDDDDKGGSKQPKMDSKFMLAAVVSLFVVVIFVLLLNIYVRCFMKRPSSRSRQRPAHGHRASVNIVIERLSSPTNQATNGTATTNKPVGLDAAVMGKLPIFKTGPQGGGECTVCLSALEEGETGRLLPNCQHVFHVECIDMWLQSHDTCPICRAGVVPKMQDAVCDEMHPSAPPLDADDGARGTAKAGASNSRGMGSFRRMLSWDRSERRSSNGGVVPIEDVER
ncbi:hypothetical protein AMTRI_Chr01g133120 [Amborella trichopoda]|uniref:RING-type E3 ubiquitin transferase n=1 Tax=Amborella trichopoda TaxID=13333 RepID=W1Q0L3_AMBTC|nr:RING-H2 finger protein ATL2 [Amborella trichopoda]ERN13976.1 hypothetical protein AMTR_s00021p00161170 [Amborella trichopoda]|eukprot:XP_006852509.1 RING-H2 finger protein ATL2 [Amborella trichopoda]